MTTREMIVEAFIEAGAAPATAERAFDAFLQHDLLKVTNSGIIAVTGDIYLLVNIEHAAKLAA